MMMTRMGSRIAKVGGAFISASAFALSVHAQPAANPQPAVMIDSVYLVKIASQSDAWYVNQYVRRPFEVRLRNVPDERSCRTRFVKFVATQGAAAGKDALLIPEKEISGEWVAVEREGSQCRAQMRWRLGDVPGQQELQATLKRASEAEVPNAIVARDTVVSWRISAHMPPAIVAGFSYALGRNPAPNDAADSVLVRRGQPFFGVEFAPPLELVRSPRLAWALEHIRLTVGTSYRSPGYDFYVGLSPSALVDGMRTTNLPVQLTVGRRWSARGNDTYFIAGTANALALLSNIVGKL